MKVYSHLYFLSFDSKNDRPLLQLIDNNITLVKAFNIVKKDSQCRLLAYLNHSTSELYWYKPSHKIWIYHGRC